MLPPSVATCLICGVANPRGRGGQSRIGGGEPRIACERRDGRKRGKARLAVLGPGDVCESRGTNKIDKRPA